MKLDTIVGVISDKRTLYKEIDGEEFYKTTISVEGADIPLVASSYVLGDKKGRCQVQCSIRQEDKDVSYRFTYIYGSQITPTEGKDRNVISLKGNVANISPMTLEGSTGAEKLVFKLASFAHKKLNLFNIVAIDKSARKLTSLKKGDIVECKCYLDMYEDKLQFCIISANILASPKKERR